MSAKVFLAGIFVLIAALAATILILLMWPNSTRGAFRAINPNVFTTGIGVYVFDDNKYSMLIWKRKFLGADNTPQEKDIVEAAQSPVLVRKDVRFFAYGIDFSQWQTVPPYMMAFCVVRDARTVNGIFPILLKPVDRDNLIYELLLPPIINNLSSGNLNHLFWAINFQNSCNEGWVFKFH